MLDASAFEGQSRYLNLGTWRRSGEVVDTPLWFARQAGALVVFTQGGSGKVKRLRASPRARVAPCDVRGRLLGEWQAARAQVVPDRARAEAGIDALRARYGWQFRILEAFARLSGRRRTWAVIEIALENAPLGGS